MKINNLTKKVEPVSLGVGQLKVGGVYGHRMFPGMYFMPITAPGDTTSCYCVNLETGHGASLSSPGFYPIKYDFVVLGEAS